MEKFDNYIEIYFNSIKTKIELPKSLDDLNKSRFFIKENNFETKYIDIKNKEIKQLLITILDLNKKYSLIYYERPEQENLMNYMDINFEQKNSFYQSLKKLNDKYNNLNEHIMQSNNDNYNNSLLSFTEEKNKNMNSINSISEVPYKSEKSNKESENNNLKQIILGYQENEKKDEAKKIILINNNEKPEKKVLHFNNEPSEKNKINEKISNSKINSIELLTVPGTNNDIELKNVSSSFTYNFLPELNYSCYGVYEFLNIDSNLINNYVRPNFYSSLKSELLSLNKKEKEKITIHDYKQAFNNCYKLINEKLILSHKVVNDKLKSQDLPNKDNNKNSINEKSCQKSLSDLSLANFSFSFILFSENQIISVNLGTCETKICKYNKSYDKCECISLNKDSEIKDEESIKLNGISDKKIEIKMYNICGRDKFFIIGNSEFWKYVFLDDITKQVMSNYYYENKNCGGAINELYQLSTSYFENYIDDISVVVIFLE